MCTVIDDARCCYQSVGITSESGKSGNAAGRPNREKQAGRGLISANGSRLAKKANLLKTKLSMTETKVGDEVNEDEGEGEGRGEGSDDVGYKNLNEEEVLLREQIDVSEEAAKVGDNIACLLTDPIPNFVFLLLLAGHIFISIISLYIDYVNFIDLLTLLTNPTSLNCKSTVLGNFTD
jgi:hypothetical protein